jgi:hypothetical protein
MTLRSYLIIMGIATFISWFTFIVVLYTIDPFITNWIGFSFFYSSLFLSVMGTASILGFLIRFIGLKKELVFRSVKAAFRQSFLFSFFIVVCLFLLSFNLLTWLNVILLIIGLSVFEYFLICNNGKYKKLKIKEIQEDNF